MFGSHQKYCYTNINMFNKFGLNSYNNITNNSYFNRLEGTTK